MPDDRHVIEAPARVFESQEALQGRVQAGELERDLVAVVRFQGPRANGMPELHKLTPPLAVLQGKGFKVALVTDGRMSGASGKVPAAIHVSPEALADGGRWPRARRRPHPPRRGGRHARCVGRCRRVGGARAGDDRRRGRRDQRPRPRPRALRRPAPQRAERRRGRHHLALIATGCA